MKTFTEEQLNQVATDFLRRIDARRKPSVEPEPFQVQVTKQTVRGEELRNFFPIPRNITTTQKSLNSNAA